MSHENENNSASTIKEATLKFTVEDGSVVTLSTDTLPLPSTGQPTTIDDFLARPINFQSWTWNTAAAVGTDIFNFNITTMILGINMYQQKFKGFRNIKCTVNFKFILAPSPFHAGAAYLSWIPNVAGSNNSIGNLYKGLIPNSQLPGVMMTCEDNSVEISIPYVGPVMGYDRFTTQPSWGWGNLRLAVYSPLATGTGANSISIDGYLWISDLQLTGMSAQSKYKTMKRTRAKGMVITDQEIGEGQGPISRVLGTGAVLANQLGDFPILTPFFKPAAWVLNALKGTAESFGYSKPTTGESVQYCMMARNQDAYAPNSNGSDNVIALGTLGDSKSTMHNMLQLSNNDESSIDFIKRKWSYYDSFTLSTANNPNDVLYTKTLAPRSFNKTYNMPASASTNYTVHWMTPFHYLSECFESYRGDLEVRLLFIKTGFHAAQIEVSFGMDGTPSTPTDYYLREVVDIQKGTEICFVLPYSRVEPFLSCWDSYGTFRVTLVNTLQAPTTVSSSIHVLVYYRGGENLQFVRPSNFVPIPIMGPQGGVKEESSTPICDSPEIVGNGKSNPDVLLSQYTVGECVKSLKNLANRYTPLGTSFSGQTLSFDPHYMGRNTVVLSTFYSSAWSNCARDYLARFSRLFLYHTGSVKIRIKTIKGFNKSCRTVLFPFNLGTDCEIVSTTLPSDNFLLPDYYYDTDLVSTGVRIPQFSKYLGYPNSNYASTNPDFYNQSIIYVDNVNADGPLTSNNTRFYRAAGEDFQFQFFLAIPTCVLSTVPS